MTDVNMEVIRVRSRDYKLSVNAPGVQAMLTDLAKFCRGVRTLNTDVEEVSPTRLAMLVGRQQVWERIQHHLNLSTEELYLIYTGKPWKAEVEDGNA